MRVVIPFGGPLRAMLDSMPRVAPTILTSGDGTPWTGDGFSTSWRPDTKRAGLSDLTFHDLRGTAVTRLAVAGCTPAEVGSITGHRAANANAILEAYYLARDPRLAQSAIRELESLENIVKKRENAVA